MSIETFKKLFPPPPEPKDISYPVNWERVENILGTKLPSDYKVLINSYGTIRLDSFFGVFNPFSSNQYVNLVNQVESQTENLRGYREDFDLVPYNIYPEDKGLLPFAISDNGDYLYWKTDGIPDNWTIVVADSRAPEYEDFHMNMTAFLVKLLTKKISCKIFPTDIPTSNPTIQ